MANVHEINIAKYFEARKSDFFQTKINRLSRDLNGIKDTNERINLRKEIVQLKQEIKSIKQDFADSAEPYAKEMGLTNREAADIYMAEGATEHDLVRAGLLKKYSKSEVIDDIIATSEQNDLIYAQSLEEKYNVSRATAYGIVRDLEERGFTIRELGNPTADRGRVPFAYRVIGK